MPETPSPSRDGNVSVPSIPRPATALSLGATVAEAGQAFLDGQALVGVDEGGTPIGTVAREDVIRLLLGGEA